MASSDLPVDVSTDSTPLPGLETGEPAAPSQEATPTESEVDAAEAAARLKAESRSRRDREYAAEREAKREARRLEREASSKSGGSSSHSGPKEVAAPLRKLTVDYYTYFGVARDASARQIRKVANARALANHPDKCPTAACRETMIIVNEARDVLLTPETRREYDFLLAYGFRIYEKELYDDLWAQYQVDPDDMPHGFADAPDFSSDYSDMNVTEESAGWLLLATGTLTLAMLAWPIIKFWESAKSDEAKRSFAKRDMLAAQARAKAEQEAMKVTGRKEKYTGERGGRRNGNNTATTTAVALVCFIGLLSLASPVSSASASDLTYYDLLEVDSAAEATTIKKA